MNVEDIFVKNLVENSDINGQIDPNYTTSDYVYIESKDELKKAVAEFKGTVILVSHEPEFYEGIVDEVINLENVSNKCV